LTDDKLIGSYPWKGGLDLLNIVLIGIANELPAHSNEYEHDDKYELHRLLSTLFSMELTASEKLGIIENEYSIPLDDKIREDVSEMCNLSQGIREKGGTEREEKIILNMHKKGYTSEQIAEIVEKSVREVEAVIQKREPVLA
ncbi:MAG: hypothetical protein NC249_14420, partial [Lachnoclostridium sp.]|nr:hypothetical protein [Lachnoclostridium sp.]